MAQWKAIEGYERYEISSEGEVRYPERTLPWGAGTKTIKAHLVNLHKHPNGYLYIQIQDGDKKRKLDVHRLVAKHFIGPKPTPDHQVNHRNGLKTDNRVENLEYLTRSENQKHAFRTGLRAVGSGIPQAKLTEDKVTEIRRLHATGEFSLNKLGSMFGVSDSTIYYITKGKIWKHVA